MQSFRKKTNQRSPRYLKTDEPQTDRDDYIGLLPINQGPKLGRSLEPFWRKAKNTTRTEGWNDGQTDQLPKSVGPIN